MKAMEIGWWGPNAENGVIRLGKTHGESHVHTPFATR